MKRFLMLVGVAVVAAAMYVAASPASQQAKKAPSAKQFNALKKQVTSLSKTLKALKADEAHVKTSANGAAGFIASCLISANAGALPINQFGTPSDGFLFGTTVTSTPRTALDVDTSTSTPFTGAYVQVVDPTCVTASGAPHALSSRLPLRAERAR